MSIKPEETVMPEALRRGLRTIDRRMRGVGVLEGLGRLAVVLVAGLLVGVMLDLAVVLPVGLRWVIWGAYLIGGVVLLWRWVKRPLSRREGWVGLAALAEGEDRTLGEAVSQAVALAEAGERAHGSAQLIGAAVEAGARRGAGIEPAKVVPSRRAWRWAGLGAGVVAAIGALAMMWPDPCGVLVERFLMPWGDRQRVSRYVVELEAGDRVVAIGDDVAVSARVRSRFGGSSVVGAPALLLRWTDEAGRVREMAMAEAAEGSEADQGSQYQLTLPRVGSSLTLQAVSGTARSQPVRVTAMAAPAVEKLAVVVSPPAYLGLEETRLTDPERVEAWQDSRVSLHLTASRALAEATLSWPVDGDDLQAGQPAVTRLRMGGVAGSAEGREWTASATAVRRGGIEFELKDRHGLMSRADGAERLRELVVRVDQAPTVELKVNREADAEETRSDDVLTAGLEAVDDVAVAEVELHYEIHRAGSAADEGDPERGQVAVTLPGLGSGRQVSGDAVLPLSRLGLRPGDELNYRARVVDNCPPPRGPHEGWSLGRTLRIVAEALPLLAQRQAAAEARIQEKLDALKAAAAQNRQATEQLRYAADAAQRNKGAWDADRQRALADQEQAAQELGDRMSMLARELAQEESGFTELAQPLAQVAEVEAEAAREALQEASESTEAADRLEDLKAADNRQAALQSRLDEFQKSFGEASRASKDRGKLAGLAERQQALAEQAREMAEQPVADRATLDQLDVEQAKLKRELGEILSRSPELKAEALGARAKMAKTLADEALGLAEQQRQEARQTGDLSAWAGPLREIARAQAELEADARRLAADVDVPLSENERGRVNVAALTEAREALERGEPDQMRARMEGAENELRRVGRDIEEVQEDSRSLARRLLKRQEQLQQEATSTLRETVRDRSRPRDEEVAALQEKLEPLRGRQEAIAGLLEPLAVPQDQEQLKREASDRQGRAIEGLDVQGFRELENRQREARDALQKLVDGLPDAGRIRNEAAKRIDESRRRTEQVTRDVERHLRETAPQQGRPYDPRKADQDLANRLRGLVQTQQQTVKELGEMATRDQIEPQRKRAEQRAQALAAGLESADRAAMAAMVRDARGALERLSQKNNGQQQPADEMAEELAEEAQVAAKPEEWRRLAAAVRALPVPDAEVERAVALAGIEQAGQGEEAAREEAARAVKALAQRLADTATAREQVETLAKAAHGAADEAVPSLPGPADQEASRLREVSEQLARVGRLAKLEREVLKPAAEAAARARDLAEARVQGAARAELLDEAREEASAKLQTLAQAMASPPPIPAEAEQPAEVAEEEVDDPELRLEPEQAAQAVELARRQRRLREQVQGLLADRVPSQREVEGQSVELGRKLAELREQLQPISPRSRDQAAQAADLLGNQAPRTMEQAVDQLGQGQAGQAKETQRRAAELLERAAQRVEDLAAILQAEASLQDEQQQPGAPGEALADAQAAQQAASEELAQARNPSATTGQAASQRAQQAMQRAAASMRMAASASAQQSNSRQQAMARQDASQSGAENPDPQAGPAGTVEAELAALQEQIQASTGRAWGELPGHLRSEILQMARGGYRQDYAKLIQLYFREIAGAGLEGKPAPGRP